MTKNQKEYEVEAIIGKRRKKNSGILKFYNRFCLISCSLEWISKRAGNMVAVRTPVKYSVYDR